MKRPDHISHHFYVFGSLMVIANKLGTLLDRDLQEFGVTSKQWFLSVVIDTFFQEPPTLKEAAYMMGSSYQNVKQIALKLEEKGLMRLEKDEKDARVMRLVLTDKSQFFWEKTLPKGAQFMERVFNHMDESQLAVTRQTLQQLLDNMQEMEEQSDQ